MPTKEQYQRNPEKHKEKNKEYRKTENGKIFHRKYTKEWLKKNPEYRKKYYLKNKNKLQEEYRKRYKKFKQYIQGYKLLKGCSICGYNKCADALCFHHNGDKEFDIGNASYSLSLDIIKKEINKCTVLCRNCHAELHEKERRVI